MIYIRLVVVFLEKFPDYSNVINTPLQNVDLRRCFRILDTEDTCLVQHLKNPNGYWFIL